MLFTPLYLQAQGLPRRLVTFLIQFLILLVTMVVNMSHEEQLRLATEVAQVPRSTDYLYKTLQLDTAFAGYVCCPKCFALYDSETWHPIKPPVDKFPGRRLPPPKDPVDAQGASHTVVHDVITHSY